MKVEIWQIAEAVQWVTSWKLLLALLISASSFGCSDEGKDGHFAGRWTGLVAFGEDEEREGEFVVVELSQEGDEVEGSFFLSHDVEGTLRGSVNEDGVWSFTANALAPACGHGELSAERRGDTLVGEGTGEGCDLLSRRVDLEFELSLSRGIKVDVDTGGDLLSVGPTGPNGSSVLFILENSGQMREPSEQGDEPGASDQGDERQGSEHSDEPQEWEELWVWDDASGSAERIAASEDGIYLDDRVVFSPDAKRVAFSKKESSSGESRDVWIWSADTGETLKLSSDVDSSQPPVLFSPDSEKAVVYSRGSAVWLWNLDTGTRTDLGRCSLDARLASSGDGTWVTFVSGSGELILADMASGESTAVAGDVDPFSVVPAPSGAVVAFVTNDFQVNVFEPDSGVRVLGAMSPVLYERISPATRKNFLSFSPDGNSLAFLQPSSAGESAQQGDGDLYVWQRGTDTAIRVDTNVVALRTTDPEEVAGLFDPTGTLLAYAIADPDGPWGTRVVRLWEVEAKRTTAPEADAMAQVLRFTGSGSALVFAEGSVAPDFLSSIQGPVALWVLDTQSLESTRLHSSAILRSVRFSADGRRLAYTANRVVDESGGEEREEFHAFDVESGESYLIAADVPTPRTPSDAGLDANFSFTADGERLVFLSAPGSDASDGDEFEEGVLALLQERMVHINVWDFADASSVTLGRRYALVSVYDIAAGEDAIAFCANRSSDDEKERSDLTGMSAEIPLPGNGSVSVEVPYLPHGLYVYSPAEGGEPTFVEEGCPASIELAAEHVLYEALDGLGVAPIEQ